MTIAKKLQHKLFITTLIMLITTNSHQLHAMGSEVIKANDETTINKDFQMYKLFSSLNNDDQWYLPAELVQIITINVSKLIDKKCYEELSSYSFLLFNFIKDKQHTSMRLISIANNIKRYLRHDGKSLDKIICPYTKKTVFHELADINTYIPSRYNGLHTRIEWIKIFCLVAGSKAWDIICIKDRNDNTPLHFYYDSWQMIDVLLSIAPNCQEAWNLITTPNKNGDTALDEARKKGWRSTANFLESYRPKEQ
jgi:hypothetical protein